MSTEVLLKEFAEVSEHPHRVLSAYKKEGKKVIGVLPQNPSLHNGHVRLSLCRLMHHTLTEQSF